MAIVDVVIILITTATFVVAFLTYLLAKKQASMRPMLEVTGVSLSPPEDHAQMWNLIREVEEDRAEIARLEEERSEKEAELHELRSRPLSIRIGREQELRQELGMLGPFYMSDPYEGPLPDWVILVELSNEKGKAAAFGIAGHLYFDSNYLEPLGYSSNDSPVYLQDGTYTLNVGGEDGILLSPGSCTIMVAASVRSPGATEVGYDLSSPMGSSAKGEIELEIPE